MNTAGFCLALLSGEWAEEARCFDRFTALSFIPLNTCVRKRKHRGETGLASFPPMPHDHGKWSYPVTAVDC